MKNVDNKSESKLDLEEAARRKRYNRTGRKLKSWFIENKVIYDYLMENDISMDEFAGRLIKYFKIKDNERNRRATRRTIQRFIYEGAIPYKFPRHNHLNYCEAIPDILNIPFEEIWPTE